MPSYQSNRTVGRLTSARQPVRLLTAFEKPQRCEWPECSKPATGVDKQKVYCAKHFFAVVSKYW
jgi:hypothetical protein